MADSKQDFSWLDSNYTCHSIGVELWGGRRRAGSMPEEDLVQPCPPTSLLYAVDGTPRAEES